MTVAAEPEILQVTQSPMVRRRRHTSWVAVLILTTACIFLGVQAYRVHLLDLGVALHYLFSREMGAAAINTLLLGTSALCVSLFLGIIVALMRISDDAILSGISAGYVYVLRGTPLLIQLVFWYNAVPTMFPNISITIPFLQSPIAQIPTIRLITPFIAALAALSLAETAYMSEILRGGLLAVDRGQRDAASALGLTPFQVLRRIVIPQALRIVLPTIGNEYIMLLKSTSLASIIGYAELVRVSTDIYSANFKVVELLLAAACWYLALAAGVTGLQQLLEKRFPPR